MNFITTILAETPKNARLFSLAGPDWAVTAIQLVSPVILSSPGKRSISTGIHRDCLERGLRLVEP